MALTDALGQVTTLEYLDGVDPLRVTRVTDPFARTALLTYDALGRLETVTDVAGMTSRFTYGVSDFITAMTTPYGTTTFRHEETQQSIRRIEAMDPVGCVERLEFHFLNTALPETLPSEDVPAGF